MTSSVTSAVGQAVGSTEFRAMETSDQHEKIYISMPIFIKIVCWGQFSHRVLPMYYVLYIKYCIIGGVAKIDFYRI